MNFHHISASLCSPSQLVHYFFSSWTIRHTFEETALFILPVCSNLVGSSQGWPIQDFGDQYNSSTIIRNTIQPIHFFWPIHFLYNSSHSNHISIQFTIQYNFKSHQTQGGSSPWKIYLLDYNFYQPLPHWIRCHFMCQYINKHWVATSLH